MKVTWQGYLRHWNISRGMSKVSARLRKKVRHTYCRPEGHVYCYKGPDDRKERGVRCLINKNLARNVEKFISVNQRVTGIVIKLNKR